MAASQLFACSEIIEIQNRDSKPEIIVEANISNNNNAVMKLSYSTNINDTAWLKFIGNAKVMISEDLNYTEYMIEADKGIYLSPSIKGKNESTYKIKIEVDGQTITVESKIPKQVMMDTFSIENSIFPGGGPALLPNQEASFYEFRVRYKDPANEANYYRIVVSANKLIKSANNVYDDRLTNGRENENFVVIRDPEIKRGDTLQIEFQCITQEVYEFYRSVSNFGGPGGSTPANPVSNLKGAKLGYFSAHTSEKVEYILP